jgi:hypothetical protein
MYDIIHEIALHWKNENRHIRPFNKFDEYLLSPGHSHDIYNHIHIYYDQKQKSKACYIIKINEKHVETNFISKKYSAKKWCEILYKKLIKLMKKIYQPINYSFIKKSKKKTIKNKKTKTIKNKK